VIRRRRRQWLGAALAAVVAAGCASTPARFYTLSSTAAVGSAAPMRATVLVGPVSIPAAVDRPQFVVQVAPNRVEIDEFNRWAAPLQDGIARVVADDLAVLLGTPDVAIAPMATFDATHRVALDVQRLDTLAGEAVVVDTVWTVRRTKDGKTVAGRTNAREAAAGAGFDALASAQSRALGRVSADVAAAIRAMSGGR
jgi:uncharacterized lipoprotein YmbA